MHGCSVCVLAHVACEHCVLLFVVAMVVDSCMLFCEYCVLLRMVVMVVY